MGSLVLKKGALLCRQLCVRGKKRPIGLSAPSTREAEVWFMQLRGLEN